jgi:hypothetical protein
MDGTGTGLTEQAEGLDERLPGVAKKIWYHGGREQKAIRYRLKYLPIKSDLTTQTIRVADLTHKYGAPHGRTELPVKIARTYVGTLWAYARLHASEGQRRQLKCSIQ